MNFFWARPSRCQPRVHQNMKMQNIIVCSEANNRGVWLHAKNEAVATVRYAIASKKCRKQNQQNLFEETILKITSPFFCTKSHSYIDSWTQNDSKKKWKIAFVYPKPWSWWKHSGTIFTSFHVHSTVQSPIQHPGAGEYRILIQVWWQKTQKNEKTNILSNLCL